MRDTRDDAGDAPTPTRLDDEAAVGEGRAGGTAEDAALPFPDEHPNRPREYHGRRTMAAAVATLGAVALALFLAPSGGGSPASDGLFGVAPLPSALQPAGLTVAPAVGALAPDFELETLDGGRFRLSDWRGHPVMVNFWASWCPPCRAEAPVLVRLQERYRAVGLIIAGVNLEEARDPARGFAEQYGTTFVVPMDFSGEVTRAYQVVGPPSTYFIDADGTIVEIFRGQGPDDAFASTTAALMATLAAPVGPDILPGPKALPAALRASAPAEGTAVGNAAADFVLRRTDGGAPWRLSEQRGRAVLLVWARPDCDACLTAVESARRGARDGPLTTVIGVVSAVEGVAVALEPDTAVAALYDATTGFRLVAIDAAGVVRGRATDPGGVPQAIAALGAAPAVAVGS